MSSRALVTSAVIATNLIGCAISDERDGIEDGEHETFDAGKADAAAISDVETRGRAVVRFVNAASRAQLSAANLSTRVVDNLAAFRAGDDEQIGTDDDGWLMTLAELDAIPFVGPAVLLALVEPALAALPRDPEQVTSCSSSWTTEAAPWRAWYLAASPTEMFTAGPAVLYQESRSGQWSPVETPVDAPASGRFVADRMGLYRLALETRSDAVAVPRIVFSTNWSGRWMTETVIPEDEVCAAAPFTCDRDPDPWFTEVRALKLDERGALHALLVLTTEDGSKNRTLLYVTNASGAWKLLRVAHGYYSPSGGVLWSRGAPEPDAAALCTGTSGAAVVFGQYLGATSSLTAATFRGDAVELRVWDCPNMEWDGQFGPEARQLDCASDGDTLHLVYESGASGGVLAHSTFDLGRRAFTTGPQRLSKGGVQLAYQPQIVIDHRQNRFHVLADAFGDREEWGYHYGTGPVGGSIETLMETPVPSGGYRPVYQPDLELTPWGVPQVLLQTYHEGDGLLYTQRCP